MADNQRLKNWYLTLFRDFENSLNGERSSPLHKLRKEAIEKFADLDFPDLHQEDWRFTDISPILKYDFGHPSKEVLPTKGEVAGIGFHGLEGQRVVFVNGFYTPELSTLLTVPQGTIIGSLADAMRPQGHGTARETPPSRFLSEKYLTCAKPAADGNIFTALNSAFILDGAYVEIPDNVAIEKPIHLIFISTGIDKTISQPRNLFVAGKNSQARIIEHYVSMGNGVYFTNAVTEAFLGENSSVETIRIQSENMNSYHIATTEVVAEADSNYESQAISLGASIYRHNLNVTLRGEGGNAALDGLYLTSGGQLSDTHSLIDHASPHCTSQEHYKGILDDRSRGVFNGKIMVRRGAQRTNSYQENRNIILSDEAKVDTKPQLEIFADDVKCSHGATVGQLDKESMFYLRSRGIGEEKAKMILIYAFADDVLKNIKIEEVRSSLESILSNRFLRG